MKLGVFGAGAIGASLGVKASSVGVAVRMVGRGSIVSNAENLIVHDRKGRSFRPAPDLIVSEDPEILSDVDLCLVAVKSRSSTEAAQTLADVLRPDCGVISMQNGMRNPQRLRAHLSQVVIPGMISYNVVRPEPAVFKQATRGPLVCGQASGTVGANLEKLRAAMQRAGEEFSIREDIEDIQAGKLLLNLNNVVCAVTGVPIAASIRSRTMRWCFSRLMREGLDVFGAAGRTPKPIVGLPPWFIARVLNLPNAIILRVAKSMVDIDPEAKSSTLQDLEAGKPTEVDDLSGEVVALARESRMRAPISELVTTAVHELEQAARPLPYWPADQLAERIRSVR